MPEELESDPSFSYSSSSESDSSNDRKCSKSRINSEYDSADDRKYSKSKIKKRDDIKTVGNARNRTRQTHCRATLIHLMKVPIHVRDAIRRRAI